MSDDEAKTWKLARALPHEAPTSEALASAPVIDNWHLAAVAGEHLVVTGNVSCSPKFCDGSDIRTSMLRGIERIRPQWVVTRNSTYKLGIRADSDLRSLLVRAALEPTWSTAAQVVADAIGMHTLAPHEIPRALTLRRAGRGEQTAEAWKNLRASAAYLAESLSQYGREAAARAVWLLSVGPDDKQQIESTYAYLAGDASIALNDDDVKRMVSGWKRLADGAAVAVDDLILAAHAASVTATSAKSESSSAGEAGADNEAPLFVTMAQQRTWWDAADLALAVTPDQVPGALGPWVRGEGPNDVIRAVALGLYKKFENEGHHDLAYLWRLLATDPSDRESVRGVAQELQVLIEAAAVPNDLGWTHAASRARIAWEALSLNADPPAHPNDPFVSAWAVYDDKIKQGPDGAPLLLRVARSRTWAGAAETVLMFSPPEVAAKARDLGLLSADPVERIRIAAEIANELFAAGDQVRGGAWRLLSTNAMDKVAIAEFADKLERLAKTETDSNIANAWWLLSDPDVKPVDKYDAFWSVAQLAEDFRFGKYDPPQKSVAAPPPRPTGVVVLREIGGTEKTSSGREVRAEFGKIIAVELRLVTGQNLASARSALRNEFPHLHGAIDVLMTGMAEGEPVRLRPTLLVGEPGGGKSRLARRLAEVLGVGLHRFDGAGSADNAFGGTPRRWSSGEHCVPLEAVRRHRIANPIVLIDEADKAGDSRHNGSLDRALLPFLEPENARAYPDPYVQSNLDLSHVSYFLTANDELALPAPLRDRLRIVRLPRPSAADLAALARGIVADVARERGGDPRWWPALDDIELAIAEGLWRGGSVRRLRYIVERLLAYREERPRQ